MQKETVLAADNFLIPNGTFFFELLLFLVVLWILATKIVPRINTALEQRQQTIRQQFEEAEKAKEDAEKARKEYTDALAETRKEISRLRDEANAEKAQIIDEARNTARMETERQQVLMSLRNEIGELAFTLSEKIVRDTLRDEQRQQKLVDDFISGVGATVQAETADARR